MTSSSASSSSSGPEPAEPGAADALERSQETLDKAKDAVRKAVPDPYPGDESDLPGSQGAVPADPAEDSPGADA